MRRAFLAAYLAARLVPELAPPATSVRSMSTARVDNSITGANRMNATQAPARKCLSEVLGKLPPG